MFTILGFITGLAGPLSQIVNKIIGLKIAQTTAETDKARMAYEQQIEEAEGRKAVLIAEAGNRIAGVINASTRGSFAIAASIIVWKLLVWDKAIGSLDGCSGSAAASIKECSIYRTDPLDVNQWYIILAVIAFYFGYDIIAKSRRS